MLDSQQDAGALVSRILREFPVNPAVPDETMLEHVRSAMGRGLPEVAPAKPHDRIMSIAGGGPSLGDTWRELDGVIVTQNAALGFLLGKGVVPWACGVLDARPHVADLIERHSRVFYFVASTCHPRVFNKLAGCKVGLWHPLGMPGIEQAAKGARYFIGGGTTMGLRWLNIGHFMGFRRFHAHGLDSSFRGQQTHAYSDFRDGFSSLDLLGHRTSMNFIRQIADWFELKQMFGGLPDGERPEIKLLGDGLLQTVDAQCSTSFA